MGACSLDPTAATVDSVIREYMAEHPNADRDAVRQAAIALDENCSGYIHSCELLKAPFLGEGMTSHLRRFLGDRGVLGFTPNGLDYGQETNTNRCEMLLSSARPAGLARPTVSGVRLRSSAA